MSPPVVGVVGFVVLVGMIFLRVPVSISLGVVGVAGYAALNGWRQAFLVLGQTPFNFASAYDLSVVTLFILMGAVARRSGMATELFQAINVVFSGRRGALAMATVGACAALGSVSGSSIAMVATMSHVAVPEMRRAGYDDRLALGSVAAAGTLGIMLPPSVMLIFYAISAEQSVPQLFAAGLIPGLTLAVLQIGVIVALTRLYPSWAPVSPRALRRARLGAVVGMWKLVGIFLVSVGGIYTGLFSPTEAAAVGAFATIVLAMATRQLDLRQLGECLVESARTASMLFFLLLGAMLFSYFLVQTQIAAKLAIWMTQLGLSPLGVMIGVIIFYIVLGSFLESLTMILITVPVFAPLASELGFSLVWFGVLLVVMVEVGMIHPPMGINLFVLQSQVPGISLTQLYLGALPFLLASAVLVVLLLAFPEIALWLPRLLYSAHSP